MENLPVLSLTQLLTAQEMSEVRAVYNTHDTGFVPVGVAAPGESCLSRHLFYGAEAQFREERYTPRAFYALSVWRETVKKLAQMPEFADSLQIEWYPVAASFRSVRYLKDQRSSYIRNFRQIAREVADKQTIKVSYGKYTAPPLPEDPDFPVRTYIIPFELLNEKRHRGIADEVEQLSREERFSYSWDEIEAFFTDLTPIQLAFNAGELMNDHGTELDQQFISACAAADLDEMKKLFEKGVNIHAVSERGEMAANCLITGFYEEYYDKYCRLSDRERADLKARIFQEKIPALQWLIRQGYDLNIFPYDGCTALYDSVHAPDVEIMRFLLENGADPNIFSWFNREGYDECTALGHVWDDYNCLEEDELVLLDEMELLLKSYGAKE